jgi:hypothetical protein
MNEDYYDSHRGTEDVEGGGPMTGPLLSTQGEVFHIKPILKPERKASKFPTRDSVGETSLK